MRRPTILFAFLLLGTLILSDEETTRAQPAQTPVPTEWLTHAEQTDYRETPDYEATLAYARRLDAASPWVRLTEFGRSGEGRALPLMVIAKGNAGASPEAARRAGRAIVLIQACIHAGETDGKDAGLALVRDIAVLKTHEALLERAVVLFIPIFNTDGHERRSPYNRINQNGPAEMGWRGNASNLNLNRDYLKADAPETRAWLRLWNEWTPDLFLDCHVTDGADFRYHVTYQFEQHENVAPSVRAWSREAFEGRIMRAAERGGYLYSPYMVFRDNRDPRKGIDSFIATPRFATGYVPVVRNRPALLIETHMLKDHRSRVRGTYDLLRAALEEVNRDPEALTRAGRQADEQTIADGGRYDPAKKLALSVALTDTPTQKLLKGFEYRTELSDVSGDVRVVWSDKPQDLNVPFYTEARASASVAPPLYYVVPPQWTSVIEVLGAHGLRLQRLASPLTIDVESYRFSEVKWGARSFEGRVLVSFKTETVRERRTYPAGSVVVSMAQPAARAALHLLEPDAPDSFVVWGFFNPIFEAKEYGENYVLEQLAREMMGKDEALRREFEARVANDPKFAASTSDRLQFFYERSPYWDRRMNLYPVARVTAPLTARLTDFK
ncbi:MAG TPA: M14 family metallopeptidase [Pyrinomonadaceae bacterium]|nr:M14 family metallopeptidase [Pyrinomonadaceae bacterium]